MAAKTIEDLKKAITGKGLVHPFSRSGGNDFVSAAGEPLVKSGISQILGTRPGELPWQPDFGFAADRYRHRNMSGAQQAALSEDLMRTLGRFEPRARITGCMVNKPFGDPALQVRVRWTLTGGQAASSRALSEPIVQEETV